MDSIPTEEQYSNPNSWNLFYFPRPELSCMLQYSSDRFMGSVDKGFTKHDKMISIGKFKCVDFIFISVHYQYHCFSFVHAGTLCL